MKPIYGEWYSYLETHYRYLKCITKILTSHTRTPSTSSLNEFFVNRLHLDSEWMRDRLTNDAGERDLAKRHLQNAWFNECALRYPLGSENLLERMRFAPWKIVQFYYTIYSGISTMLRFVNSKKIRSHNTALNLFVSEIVSDKRIRNRLFPAPLCFVLKGEQLLPDPNSISISRLARSYCSELVTCLVSTRNHLNLKGQAGLVHYFRWLREWANYSAGYIFANLYGDVVRQRLDDGLLLISNSFMLAIEISAASFLGLEDLLEIYRNFRKMTVARLQFEPSFLDERMSLLEKKRVPTA